MMIIMMTMIMIMMTMMIMIKIIMKGMSGQDWSEKFDEYFGSADDMIKPVKVIRSAIKVIKFA